jgi:predicted PurR-regulated permease PerM
VSCVNAVLGLVLWLALRALEMPGAALWGVVAAIVNYVPYFGPVVGVGGLLLAGLTEFKGLGEAFVPAAIYLGLHLLESNLVTPLVLGRRLRLNPLVVFIALLFWTWVWGVPGALLAVPILLCLRIVAERVERLAPLVEFLDR